MAFMHESGAAQVKLVQMVAFRTIAVNKYG
jgi:hypothetical protein